VHVGPPYSLLVPCTNKFSLDRFKDAAASILRTTTEFDYQLVIQRAYEEGEEQLYQDDDREVQDGTPHFRTAYMSYSRILGPRDERATLLDESLHFRSMIEDGTVVLAWRDLSGDPGDIYKFICDPSTPPQLSRTFELVGTLRPSQDRFLTGC